MKDMGGKEGQEGYGGRVGGIMRKGRRDIGEGLVGY